MNQNQIEIVEKIGEFFLELNGKNYEKTERILRNMEITRVDLLSKSKIMILLRRPGLLIGPKGQTIDGLSKHLKMEIQIVEDTQTNLYDYLIPRVWSEY